MSTQNSIQRHVVELDGMEAAFTANTIEIADYTTEMSILLGAQEAVALHKALDERIEQYREAARAGAIADLWSRAAEAAAELARQGVEVYSVRVDWTRDYTARQAEIQLGSTADVATVADGAPVQVIPTASEMYEYHQVELRPGVVAQAQVRRPATADAIEQGRAAA
ncbi:MAG: hypothetical protein PGN11_16210 [Quadrisphaera sp.]